MAAAPSAGVRCGVEIVYADSRHRLDRPEPPGRVLASTTVIVLLLLPCPPSCPPDRRDMIVQRPIRRVRVDALVAAHRLEDHLAVVPQPARLVAAGAEVGHRDPAAIR